ncbi:MULTISPECIES: cellulose biosynthesis protein BcsO [Enterobacter]|uniref:cellulose biosynthesis protein BcsO n=1 Tax=Enterobacter TaxID=547 RepID=UPI0028ECBDAE|nr:cellulose biosynthesis protein BcsO [Enterobacter cloacae]HDR2790873.1 cellulose biosynthesis protein BcsO [Enterobacter asburiae]WNT36336.1 cellulose biosynthesis protein BcsO [Enterobacter cloacae]HDR2794723.1 cellulose biosynthesis protein BcsO [Enterobacter asburiae]HDR2800020.1 cellulose biosynthesis protein BcsO [Enterobacter asburiae]HDR2807127.1 cellulose biosynthesis protein BcsO [Enterobacter asburiae]
MNHYDDLQRFKDKTRSQSLDFKDFSAQNHAQEQGSWAIINQLLPATEVNSLAAGGHVSLSAPQPVTEETFAVSELTPVPQVLVAEPAPTPVSSILQGVDEQLASTLRQAPAMPTPTSARVQVSHPVTEPEQGPVDFTRLFAPATTKPVPAAEKNQPLNSLLERIATCR